MQKELTQAKVVVEAATQDCNALLEVITSSTADVETKQSVAIAKEEDLKVLEIAVAAVLRSKSGSSWGLSQNQAVNQDSIWCTIRSSNARTSRSCLLACLLAFHDHTLSLTNMQ